MRAAYMALIWNAFWKQSAARQAAPSLYGAHREEIGKKAYLPSLSRPDEDSFGDGLPGHHLPGRKMVLIRVSGGHPVNIQKHTS